jgi:hypothetical protein
MILPDGTMLNRYEIRSTLSAGGMSKLNNSIRRVSPDLVDVCAIQWLARKRKRDGELLRQRQVGQ